MKNIIICPSSLITLVKLLFDEVSVFYSTMSITIVGTTVIHNVFVISCAEVRGFRDEGKQGTLRALG